MTITSPTPAGWLKLLIVTCWIILFILLLRRDVFIATLDMLTGRFPSNEVADLRPRITWNRADDTLVGRKGTRLLVATNAGTIPDRGLYGVFLAGESDGDKKKARRVGELDEEMVHEARVGETFMLGASTWRIQEITRDKVMVTPAPGEVYPWPRIEMIYNLGDAEKETLKLVNPGPTVQLEGWRLRGASGREYAFPAVELIAGGAILVHSAPGVNTPVDLYWGLSTAAWQHGEEIVLLDGQGQVRSAVVLP